ncbi:MAG: AAA family ATPase [Bacteriovoracaceae bacterium]
MKMLVKLPFIKQLDDNLKLKNGLLQVIVGPRQVGKTTSILAYLEVNHAEKFHYVSADQVFNSSAEWLYEQWMIAYQDKKILVVDEIQKCENWSEVIKKLWDDFKREKKINQLFYLVQVL